jgi:hypothetical protein
VGCGQGESCNAGTHLCDATVEAPGQDILTGGGNGSSSGGSGDEGTSSGGVNGGSSSSGSTSSGSSSSGNGAGSSSSGGHGGIGGAVGGGSSGGGSTTSGGSSGGSSTGGPPPCTTETWSNFAQGFFSSNCVSCHSEFETYSGVSQESSDIESRISDGSMPKNGTLSSTEKQDILDWLTCGLPE